MTIIARKPRPALDNGHLRNELVIIDRGDGEHMRFVVGTVNRISLKHGEWFWGHYFRTQDEALAYFNEK